VQSLNHDTAREGEPNAALIKLLFGGLVLNVLVKQFDLVALFTEFDTHQIAHRKHSYPAFTIDDRQVASSYYLHSLESLMRGLIASDYCTEFARYFSNADFVWVAPKERLP